MRILAATDFSTRSNRALRQAGLLAKAGGTQLDIVHVVDDDQPAQMIETERREADRVLAEQMKVMPELSDVLCEAMVVVGDPFDGILRTAAAAKADLIVMGQHRRQLLRDIFVGTTIERVIRARSFPVLMVNNEAQQHYERILIPVDMSEPSANAILVARQARLVSESRPTLLHAFQPLARGKMLAASSSQAAIDEYVASERQQARTGSGDIPCRAWPRSRAVAIAHLGGDRGRGPVALRPRNACRPPGDGHAWSLGTAESADWKRHRRGPALA